MAQNSMRLNWNREKVDKKLYEIMQNIHSACLEYGNPEDNFVDYVKGSQNDSSIWIHKSSRCYD